jgi:hypothetical protein
MVDDDQGAIARHDAAAQTERAARLQQEVARLAGAIAVTEDQVAATRRHLAERDVDRADAHLHAAVEAERFAAHEREEHRRWQGRR